MSSRFPPNSSDPRYPPRDRSPPRFSDRRPSAQYNGPPPRNTEGPYRPSDLHSYPGPQRDVPREAPRGPKAAPDGPRSSGFAPRGRGFAGRGEARELRDAHFLKRDGDRDWPRRENVDSRDRRLSSPIRNRSRSPPVRDSREARDGQPRDLDLTRVRRNSRDGPLSATSSVSDAPSTAGFFNRGGFRGRGRGDWDLRGRGRGMFVDDRDRFQPSNRSRERIWDRDVRDEQSRDRERDNLRRDDEKRIPKEDWDRDFDRQRKDPPPFRPESRNSVGSHTRPSTPHSQSLAPLNVIANERSTSKPVSATPESDRRASATLPTSSTEQNIKDDNRTYQSPFRPDPQRSKVPPSTPSSPPQAPPVPAFGSIAYRATSSSQLPPQNAREEQPLSAPARFEISDPIRTAPKAPKAELGQAQPPTGPKGGPSFARRLPVSNVLSPSRNYEAQHEIRSSVSSGNVGAPSPSTNRFGGGPQRPGSSHHTQQIPTAPAAQIAQTANQRPMLLSTSRPNYASPNTAQNQVNTESATRHNHNDGHAGNSAGLGSIEAPVRLIPRGPRTVQPRPVQPSIRAPMAPRAALSRGNIWVNPNFRPSIMSTVPPTANSVLPLKRDYTGDERAARSHSGPSNQDLQQSHHSGANSGTLIKDGQKDQIEGGKEICASEISRAEEMQPDSAKQKEVEETTSVTGEIREDGEDEQDDAVTDEEDGMDLDEEDFEDGERRFDREMRALRAKRPATPRHHADLLSLLEEIDTLDSALEDIVNGVVVERTETAPKLALQTSLTSPPLQQRDVTTAHRDLHSDVNVDDTNASESSIHDIDNLPYLVSGPPTPLSEISILQEDHVHHDKVKSRLLDYLARRQEQMNREYEEMRQEYARLYKPWKVKVEALDEERRLMDEAAAATPSPVPESVVTTPLPILESRRGGRVVTSEYDFQRILELSKKETAEAEEIRERQAQESEAFPDMRKEATIPDMLSTYNAKMAIFEETNHLISTQRSLEAFSFVPLPDDFTLEEHKLFTENYMIYEKKWGHIAQAIPGRDYQDCIRHYYWTKKESNYKGQLSKRNGKKGRKPAVPRGTQGRPKSNALISDLGGRGQTYGSIDLDVPQVAVTETGRPKRGAAPTFGINVEKSDSDPVTPTLTPGRRGAGRGETSHDGAVEKSVQRRGRGGQPRERGARRGRVLAAAPGPSPSKKEQENPRGKSKEPKLEDIQKSREVEDPQLLTIPQDGHSGPNPVPQTAYTEPWSAPIVNNIGPLDHRVSQVQPLNQQHQQHQQQTAQENQLQSQKHAQTRGPGAQTSSYWSVPEQQDFLKLLGHYGTDWHQIASMLKTKTHVMVKNYFTRQVESGKTEIVLLADHVDEKIRRGEQMGNPPQPTQVQKRRPDSSTQTIAQRPLAPSTDGADAQPEIVSFSSNATAQQSPPQFGQAPPRLAPLIQPGPVSTVISPQSTPAVRAQASSQQQQRSSQSLPGPRAGYFNTERSSHTVILQGPASSIPQRDAQQQQHQPVPPQPQYHRGQAANVQEVDEVWTRKYKATTEQEPSQGSSRYPQVIHQQPQPVTHHQIQAPPQAPIPHVRKASIMSDGDRKLRVSSLQQQSPADPSPPTTRRLDTLSTASQGQGQALSPISARPALPSPSKQTARPSSVPATTPFPQPQRAAPAPTKKFDISSILNEPAEPLPRKAAQDPRLSIPVQRPQSPAVLGPLYQQHGPQLQPQRRDPGHDSAQMLQQQHLHHQQVHQQAHQAQQVQQAQHSRLASFSQMSQQMQTQPVQQHPMQQQAVPPQQPPPPQRSPPAAWQAPRQPAFFSTGYYPPHMPDAPQPPVPSVSLQPLTSRSAYYSQPSHLPSPPPGPAHSRTASYSALHPSQQPIQQQPTQVLKPSPYAQIQPHNHQQQPPHQTHPLQPQQPRPQPTFATSAMQHEQMLRQQLQHEDAIRQEAMRRQQHEALMQQDSLAYQEGLMRQEALRQEALRQQDLARGREEGRRFTPPGYGPQGQAQAELGRRYEERR